MGATPVSIPCRCNKCKARKSLSKRPEFYQTWPGCPIGGCKGILFVDNYRLKRGKKDRARVCKDDCKPYPHRVDSKDCKQYPDHVIDRALAGTMPTCDDEEAPF